MQTIKLLLKYVLSSTSTFFLDIGLFWVFIKFFGDFFGTWAILLCTVFARIISAATHFCINRFFVFKSDKPAGGQALRYFILATVQMCASAGLLWLLSIIISGDHSANTLALLKTVVEIVIFFFSFFVQRKWVFSK